ncbi:MAG TPA: FAD-binding oxidoreductase, partial [Myxococcales bacterium]|nr:FAD-binding oxidoreductase [Myxococcales bacterium]
LREELSRGTPVVGLEPSCVATFRDELCELFPHDQDAKRLRDQTYLLSEFLLERANGWKPPRLLRKAIVHGHCHHKSVLGFDDEKKLLEEIGLDAEILDSGCCGMAGSFGFEKEKYDVSMKVGERKLLPKARECPPGTLLIADGFSCREQVEQGAGKVPLHIAQVLQLAIRQKKGAALVEQKSRRVRRGVLVAGIAVAAVGAVLIARAA